MVQPLSEKQKRYLRRLKGIKKPFSLDNPVPAIKKVREFNGPMREGFVFAKPRGRSGTRMSNAHRAAMVQRSNERAAFFASLES